MTYREKLKLEHPGLINDTCAGGCSGCPHDYGYCDYSDGLCYKAGFKAGEWSCKACWDREIEETASDVSTKKDCYNESLEHKAADIVRCFHTLVEGGFARERAFDIIIALLKGGRTK